jgi:hypothetical protein
MNDPDAVIRALADAEVEFVLIGGWAAILNGSVRTTVDVDICYLREPGNLERLASALKVFQPRLRDLPPDLLFVWDAATLRNGTIFTLVTSVGPVDLLAEVSGLGDFDRVKGAAKMVAAFGRQIWTLDLRGLIAAKRAAGRRKDLEAILELEGLLEASGG